MTDWQWRVIMALVRIVLSILDTQSWTHFHSIEDELLLREAIRREGNDKSKDS